MVTTPLHTLRSQNDKESILETNILQTERNTRHAFDV